MLNMYKFPSDKHGSHMCSHKLGELATALHPGCYFADFIFKLQECKKDAENKYVFMLC